VPKVKTDDDVLIDYVLDDFTNPWDDVQETIGCLHGSTLNKKFYQPMVPYLAHQYRVLRWDQRARGESSAPPPGSTLSGAAVDDGETLAARYARDALAVMDHLGIDKINWVGDSSGGITGAWFAVLYPDRIKSLVCIQSPLVKIPEDFEKHWSAGEKDPATAIEKYGMAKYYEIIGTDWVTDPNKGTERFKVWQREQRKKINAYSYTGHWKWQSLNDLTPRLHEIKCPTLLLTGDQTSGCICPLEQQQRIQRQIPDCELKVYEDMGHGIAFLEPEKASRDILDFIKRRASA
jgi:3-oxoadipate enol-lactonase